ncbi:MAG: hypothetical protein CM1200mP39_16590 [Dehalococcoidia bacterium]|nr:MAG: hypothetical protein CM1200mP39_16590 [Dehalococcoidia bacterium]
MNASAVLKSRVGMGRTEPSVPSVVSIWRGADYPEREVWDLMGIRFDGHPNQRNYVVGRVSPGIRLGKGLRHLRPKPLLLRFLKF